MNRTLLGLLTAILLLPAAFSDPASASALPNTPAPASPTEEVAPVGMGVGQALVLGIVEGLTEYLPVSSTGHLKLTQHAMGIGLTEADKDAANAYAICIQAGAILAVLGLYWRHIRRMVLGLVGRDPEGFGLVLNVGVAFLPAALVGLLFDDLIKDALFGLWPIVAAWFVGGFAILAVDRLFQGPRETDHHELYRMGWKQALLIGSMQCLAVWPGTSRSLATILGGRFAGLSLGTSVTFSFLLGAVTLTAATAWDSLKHGSEMLELYGLGSMAVGAAAATLSAIVAVRWMVHYLQRHSMALFGWYRIGLAVVVAALVASGQLSA